MQIILGSLLEVVNVLLGLYKWAIVLYALLSWLITLRVINVKHQFLFNFNQLLARIVTPVLMPLRRLLPSFGGIDLSLLALLLVIVFLQGILLRIAF